jgi:hypothetical protein
VTPVVPVRSVAVVPSAPLLLPAVTGPDADDLRPLREAVAEVLADLLATRPAVVAVAGAGAAHRLGGLGAPVPVPGRGRDTPGAGWVHDLGRVLLAHAGFAGGVRDVVLAADGPAAPPPDDIEALLVLADGSVTRGPRAPGGDDPRGEAVDARLAADLAAGRTPGVDGTLATELGVGGVPGLALAATAAAAAGLGWRVTWTGAPAGVGYLVAVTTASDRR